jgi:hypothetical protein
MVARMRTVERNPTCPDWGLREAAMGTSEVYRGLEGYECLESGTVTPATFDNGVV